IASCHVQGSRFFHCVQPGVSDGAVAQSFYRRNLFGPDRRNESGCNQNLRAVSVRPDANEDQLAAIFPFRFTTSRSPIISLLSLTWRNWQTRTAQDRMGKPVEVRVLS